MGAYPPPIIRTGFIDRFFMFEWGGWVALFIQMNAISIISPMHSLVI